MVPQSTTEELKQAEKGAYEAFKLWKEVPIQQRQVMKIMSIRITIIIIMTVKIMIVMTTWTKIILVKIFFTPLKN